MTRRTRSSSPMVSMHPLRSSVEPLALISVLPLLIAMPAVAAAIAADVAECASASRATPTDAFSAEEWNRLRDGDVLFGESGSDGGYRGAIIVDAPPSEVWAVLGDFEAWPTIVPPIESISVRAERRPMRLRQRMKVLWKRFEYTVVSRLDERANSLSMVLDRSEPSDLDRLEARFEVMDLENGRSVVQFYSLIEAGIALPGMVKRALGRSIVPDSLRSIHDEIMRRNASSLRTAALPVPALH